MLESDAEFSMVCPRENEVSVKANAKFMGVERNGRNQYFDPVQAGARFTSVEHSGRS